MMTDTATQLECKVITKDLLYALNFASTVVEKRNIISHLSHIKLTSSDQGIIVNATDMDMYLSQMIGAQITSQGETTVGAQVLSDIIRKFPDDKVTLKHNVDSNILEVIGNNCRFELPTLPPMQFPQIEDVEGSNKITLSCKDLALIIEHTQFAMSTDETRYNLNGIFLHINNEGLCAVATDGHRLSLSSAKATISDQKLGVIIPRKTIQELLKIIKDNKNINSDVEITFTENKIKFNFNNIIFISKLIDSIFPDYDHFIPENNPYQLKIHAKSLADAIDRVSTITVEKFRAVKLHITNNSITISGFGDSRGSGSEVITFTQLDGDNFYNGEEIEIGFNPVYILNVLNAINHDQVSILINDSLSPVLINNQEQASNSFVIMPIRV